MEKKIYQIMTGINERFYFTEFLPFILEEKVVIKNPFEKIKHSFHIAEQEIFVEYKFELKEEELNFPLESGVIIKSFSPESLKWLDVTYEQAELKLKDKELEFYRNYFATVTSPKKQTGLKLL